jgi:ABC-2 type transport system ATP-binding protein
MKKANDHPILKVADLDKWFGPLHALDGVSFDIRRGELFGFLGPNGAGKSTTINILTGLARADHGKIEVAGIDCTKNVRGAQHLIGVVPDESNLYPELTGFDNLCFCAALYGMRKQEREFRAKRLLGMFDLADAGSRKFEYYSKGMKRKLTIAAGIIHDPEILFLDEPTTGLDVASARQLRKHIQNMHDKGKTIFLTTHYIEEAERLCDRIAFLVKGIIVKEDTVENLIQSQQHIHKIRFELENQIDEALKEELAVHFSDFRMRVSDANQFYLESSDVLRAGPVVSFLEEKGYRVMDARIVKPSLEEVFVNVTGIEADKMRTDVNGKGMNK